MLGFGRFGGIAGSLLVAELTRRQFTFAGIFSVVALPGLVAALALLVKRWAQPARSAPAGGFAAH
jgi:AAHS family 4-hydroxybenzoate transporter-like MFS transporter